MPEHGYDFAELPALPPSVPTRGTRLTTGLSGSGIEQPRGARTRIRGKRRDFMRECAEWVKKLPSFGSHHDALLANHPLQFRQRHQRLDGRHLVGVEGFQLVQQLRGEGIRWGQGRHGVRCRNGFH